jgi:hypothetical protein
MAKKYTFLLKGDPAVKLEQIEAAAAKSSVFFSGGLKSGRFHGGIPALGLGISDTYGMVENKITVTVDEKPSIYSREEILPQVAPISM